MKRTAAPWRRLALIAGVVLAAHLALLLPHPGPQLSSSPSALHFQTRVVEGPQPAPAAATPEVAAPAAPAAAIAPPAAVVPARALRPRSIMASGVAPAPAAPAIEAAAPAPAATLAVAGSAPEAGVAAAAAATANAGSAAPTRTFAIPPSTRLRYEVTAHWHGIPISGQARLDWRQDGKQYEARLEVTSPGLPSRVQRSVGRIGEEGLAPSYFSDKARSEQATHFEREQGRLVFSNNQPPAPLVAGMQDRLSVVLQLAAMVAGQPARFARGSEIAIPTASTREAETWTFTVEGEEDLLLPGGKVRTLKLQRLPRKQYDQKVELWLAPGMDYAPVRLRLTNPGGDAVDQRWASTDRG
jgi:hypothetical protein